MGEIVSFQDAWAKGFAVNQLWRRYYCIEKGIRSARKTSITMESEFWVCLELICLKEGRLMWELMNQIDKNKKKKTPLSTALRVYALSSLMTTQWSQRQIADMIKKISEKASSEKPRLPLVRLEYIQILDS